MTVRGHIVYEDIEGGIWGIRGDDGNNYLPVDGLPGRFRKVGRRIKAEVTPVTVFTTSMWGRTVRLTSIEKA